MENSKGNGISFFTLIIVGLVVMIIVSTSSDQYKRFTSPLAGKKVYTAKTGERLAGINANVVLIPRKSDDPKPGFWLSNGKEEIWKRCEWSDYESPVKSQPEGGKEAKQPQKHTFGKLRLEKGWGDCYIYVTDLVVEKDNTVTIKYCVE
jgi:hypothetical protein